MRRSFESPSEKRPSGEDQFVSTFAVVARTLFDRVTGVNQVQEADAFDHAATVNVQAGNDSFCKH